MKFRNILHNNPKTNLKKFVLSYGSSKGKKLIIFAVCIFVIIFGICFLYQPAYDCYHAVRDRDRLQVQYDKLLEINNDLNNNIDSLQTEEGIRQKAADTLGLVQDGESMAYVTGLKNEEKTNQTTYTNSKVAYKKVDYPVTWYSPFLDTIFNVHN